VSTARQLHYSHEEYLDALDRGELRLEYLNGEIFAMAGGSPQHGMIVARVIQVLGARLPSSCKTLTSDVKVRIEATGLSTFPDVSVVCGELELAANDRNAVTNPTLLVEVSSPSTEDYDGGEKLRHYQAIPTMKAVILIAQDEKRISVVRRTDSGWTRSVHHDEIELEQTGTIAVASFYP
jgi:Uma2 family endonuclease